MSTEKKQSQSPHSEEVPVRSSASSDTGITHENKNFLQRLLEWAVKLYKPKEFRANIKLWSSGTLALSIWILLGFLVYSHFEFSKNIARQISELEPELIDQKISLTHQENVQLHEKANTIIDSTSNRLYTFLTPIVTAITGYFFASSASRLQDQQGGSGSGDGGAAN